VSETHDSRYCRLALRVCETYVSSVASFPSEFSPELKPYAFVYLSAEDIGRPIIPRRYVETKRQAERGIKELCQGTDVRGIFIRPSNIFFVFHHTHIFTWFHHLQASYTTLICAPSLALLLRLLPCLLPSTKRRHPLSRHPVESSERCHRIRRHLHICPQPCKQWL
jgi:hypothetical protein